MTGGHNAGRMRSAALAVLLAVLCLPAAWALGQRGGVPAPYSAGQAGHASTFQSQSTRNQPNRPRYQSRPVPQYRRQASGVCRAASRARLSRARGFIPAIRVPPIRGLVILLHRMGLPAVLLTSIPERPARPPGRLAQSASGSSRPGTGADAARRPQLQAP